MTLNPRKKYIQIAFNIELTVVEKMVQILPKSDNLILEAGTLLIKKYGSNSITRIKKAYQKAHNIPVYCVADLKSMDRAETEVSEFALAGANAVTCLALAPIETIDLFIEECEKNNIDSALDMLNVDFPFEVLQKLKKLPKIIIFHRGVDEANLNREKELPLREIHRVKGSYNNVLVAIAGGETPREIRRVLFNDSNIAIVWKDFANDPVKSNEIANNLLKYTK